MQGQFIRIPSMLFLHKLNSFKKMNKRILLPNKTPCESCIVSFNPITSHRLCHSSSFPAPPVRSPVWIALSMTSSRHRSRCHPTAAPNEAVTIRTCCSRDVRRIRRRLGIPLRLSGCRPCCESLSYSYISCDTGAQRDSWICSDSRGIAIARRP